MEKLIASNIMDDVRTRAQKGESWYAILDAVRASYPKLYASERLAVSCIASTLKLVIERQEQGQVTVVGTNQ